MKLLVTCDVGDQPIITAQFTDKSGADRVATAVTFTVKTPRTGAEVSASSPHDSIEEVAPNVWEFTMPVITAPGNWIVRGKSTAGIRSAGSGVVHARPTEFIT